MLIKKTQDALHVILLQGFTYLKVDSALAP